MKASSSWLVANFLPDCRGVSSYVSSNQGLDPCKSAQIRGKEVIFQMHKTPVAWTGVSEWKTDLET
jgi:hypothetical protein